MDRPATECNKMKGPVRPHHIQVWHQQFEDKGEGKPFGHKKTWSCHSVDEPLQWSGLRPASVLLFFFVLFSLWLSWIDSRVRGPATPFCRLSKCACSGSSSSVGKVPINLPILPILPRKPDINLSGLLVPEAEGSINLPLPLVSTMKASIALFMPPVPQRSELRLRDLLQRNLVQGIFLKECFELG